MTINPALALTKPTITASTVVYEIDPITGFVSFEGHPFTAKAKAAFLNIFEKTGDEALAMKSVGSKYSKKLLTAHKTYDKVFGEAFTDMVSAMVNKLEGTMYTRGLDPKGTLDRFGWLRAHAPEKYAPKPSKEDESTEKKKLEELYAKAIDIDVVFDVGRTLPNVTTTAENAVGDKRQEIDSTKQM